MALQRYQKYKYSCEKLFIYIFFISIFFDEVLNAVLKLYRSRVKGNRVFCFVDLYLTTSSKTSAKLNVDS